MGDPRPGRRDGSAGRLGGTGEAHAAEHEPPGSTSVEDRPGKAPNGDGGTRGGTGFRAVAQSVGAAMIGVVSGVVFYGFWSMVWEPAHYIHGMAVTLVLSIAMALVMNKLVFGQTAKFSLGGNDPLPEPA